MYIKAKEGEESEQQKIRGGVNDNGQMYRELKEGEKRSK